MEILCKELRERILHFKVINCYSIDLRRFFFILKDSKQQEVLFFCFVPPFLRFHLLHPHAYSHPHCPSHPLFSFLPEATIHDICLLQHDRILKLTFSTLQGERWLIAEFFSKHPNYYLTQPDGKILFALHSLSQTHYHLPRQRPPRTEIAQWLSHREVEQAYEKIEKEWQFNQDKQNVHQSISKRLKKLKSKEQQLLENLKECLEWEKIQHEGNLIKAHLTSIKKGTSSFRIHDWKTDQPYDLILDPSKTPQESMIARFRRAKKLQAGQAPLTLHLEQTQQALRLTEQRLQQLILLKTAEELADFKNSLSAGMQPSPSIAVAHRPAPIYREYASAKGIKIWVGKSAKSNDQLTFQLANGRDWWLHVKGYSGSHVIIRMHKDQEPDSETLQDAMQLALHYSQAKNQGESEICFTQRKYVSRLGKKAGLVQISKHQIAWIRLDSARLKALKERVKKDG